MKFGIYKINPAQGRKMLCNPIYNVKPYVLLNKDGVIHKGHHYGNLDTINEWFWGKYYPVKKQVQS